MKRKMLLLILAAVPAALLPLAASSQIAPEKTVTSTEPTYKYELFAGWGYTSLNQVSQSTSGLQGFTLSGTRNFGKYFGVTVDGGHYAWDVTATNPVPATVDLLLAGPVLHAPLYERLGIFVHGLLGTAHTGGDVVISPNYSFAGGIGVGLDYKLKSQHWGLRTYGDYIGSSFTLTPFQPGFSPHVRFNGRASVGVTYKF